jgi:hypothetical protein
VPPGRLRRNRRRFAADDARAARSEPQADSSERPFWRRAARMARPARVRMRRRKPWVLARRRLFGWNVRLLTRFLRYCTAMRGSVLKVVRGTKSDDAVTGRQNRTATGMREWPSTQASSKVRESTGHGQTHQACRDRGQHVQRKPPMVNQHRWPCQATRRATQHFLNNSMRKSLCGRPEMGTVACWRRVFQATSRIMHNLWITVWREGIRCSPVAPTRATGSGQEEWGRTDRD